MYLNLFLKHLHITSGENIFFLEADPAQLKKPDPTLIRNEKKILIDMIGCLISDLDPHYCILPQHFFL